MAKKINWPEIKKRYLQGDKPATIATEYGLTSKQVRDKAYREGWGTQKATLCDEISAKIATEIKVETIAKIETQLLDHFTLMDSIFGIELNNIHSALPNMGALRKDGEQDPNAYHLEAHKQGLKHYLELKKLAARNTTPDEKPGFNIIMPGAEKPADDA